MFLPPTPQQAKLTVARRWSRSAKGLREPNAWTAAILRNELDACRLERRADCRNCFCLEAVTFFETSDRLRCYLRCFGQFPHAPPKSYSRHLALDRANFITG